MTNHSSTRNYIELKIFKPRKEKTIVLKPGSARRVDPGPGRSGTGTGTGPG